MAKANKPYSAASYPAGNQPVGRHSATITPAYKPTKSMGGNGTGGRQALGAKANPGKKKGY